MINPKEGALAWLAEQFVGVTETKTNGGAMIEKFQRAVDGVASGEPWCVCFVQHCVKQIDELFDRALVTYPPSSHNVLFGTEWTIGLWESTPKAQRRLVPTPGCIVVWQHDSNKMQGHCGIITGVFMEPTGGVSLRTVEGNTGAVNQRDGDGVWQKQRVLGNIPGFTRLGYLAPWQ